MQDKQKMHKTNVLYLFLKRFFDLSSSFLFIIVFSWLYILILIVNLFATKGSPIYFDKRVGKNGKQLRTPKFRSMYRDANKNAKRYLNDEQYQEWKSEGKILNDPRITPFGRFLRKSSLDELPQIFVILFGKMSVVGPRPVTKNEIDVNYSKEESVRLLSVKPGLISNWGVNGRNDITYKDGKRQKLELEYLDKQSIFYDLKLILKSIGVVLSGKGAK